MDSSSLLLLNTLLIDSLDKAGAVETAGAILAAQVSAQRDGASVTSALTEGLYVPDGGVDPETGGPSVAPVPVPEACVPQRDALIAALAEAQHLDAEVAAAERAVGWDPNP